MAFLTACQTIKRKIFSILLVIFFWLLQFRKKIIIFFATGCDILKLKCTKFDFGWGSAPHPAGGAYSARPNPLAGF